MKKKLTLPGSKSITNRDLVLAALSEGITTLHGVLLSDDTHYMMEALKKLGFKIKQNGTTVEINGGIEKLKGSEEEIFLGASGTSIRFLTGLAVLNKDGEITLKGTERLNQRPLGDLINGIKQLGVEIESNGNFPPVKLKAGEIKNSKVRMKGNLSSQFFTSLLQIGACLPNGIEIEVKGDLVSKPYIDITINELEKFGIEVKNQNYKNFKIKKQNFISPGKLTVEGDASALSYIAAFSLLHGIEIEITNLGKNSKQGDYKFLEFLENIFDFEWESGGEKTILKRSFIGNECNNPVVNENFHSLHLKTKNSSLKNNFNFEPMPDISMTFMILAPFIPGKTKITGLQTLNLKECKRIDAMRDELKKFGIEVNSTEDWIEIGEIDLKEVVNRHACSLQKRKIQIETYDDHRIAMSFGIFKSYLDKINSGFEIEILDPSCVNKTYPNFWKDLEYLQN